MSDFESATLFFGQPWGPPLGKRQPQGSHPVDTPVGQPCGVCTEPIAEGDHGFVRAVIRDAGILTAHEVVAVHAECEALGVVGHSFGVCSCTGYGRTREAALLLWQRLGNVDCALGGESAGVPDAPEQPGS
jgi:hypothetical protein